MRLALSPGYPPDNSAMKNVALLLGQKAIDKGLVDLLKRMHNLRDMAAHRSGFVERLRELRRAP